VKQVKLHLKRFSRLFLVGCVLLSSCDEKAGSGEMKKARKLSSKHPSKALEEYRRVIQVYPQDPIAIKAALEASKLCLKGKSCADKEEYFLDFVIKKSDQESEQIAAQKRLAEVYYDKGFYPQAIEEMNRLLSKSNFKKGREEIKIKLAKSNFYIKNFYQAEVELNSYIKEVKSDQGKFEGYLLRADIQAANKKYVEALNTYKDIKSNFKDLYFKNQVYMNEVLLLEEQKLLDQAVAVLEEIRSDPDEAKNQNIDFIDSKIEKLKERKALMPGASGLKR
jgi:tetratricopeptide (TPR) repeat protein